MSYKIPLTELRRDGEVPITQQLVDRFIAAIDAGELDPGEKLPTTRALAAEAGINYLTPARVYRRLAELDYVKATAPRAFFVRALPPATTPEQWDVLQIKLTFDPPMTHALQVP